MKETGLMFKAPLVRAILEGRKTQTRRIVKPQPAPDKRFQGWILDSTDRKRIGKASWGHGTGGLVSDIECIGSPCGKPGDRIYVRETFAPYERDCFYRADSGSTAMGPWKPAIHMPKELARIWLEVTGVRVERLQDISESDAQAEGCSIECMTPTGDDSGSAIYGPGGFAALWGSTTGRPALPANTNSKRYARVKHWLDTHPDTNGWDANPWVWVVDFKVLSTTGRPA